MKKIIISMMLIISVSSVEALVCPSKVMCTDDGSGAKCTADLPGSPWYQSQFPTSVMHLPKLNTVYYFNFIEAGSTIFPYFNPHLLALCGYMKNGPIDSLLFTTNFSLAADVKAAGNNWVISEGGRTCAGNTTQCPFAIVTAKNH